MMSEAQDVSPKTGGEGWSPALLDPGTDPRRDFYAHATGPWRRRHPIPEDRSRWGTFDELHRRNIDRVLALLEEASSAGAETDPLLRALGRFYRRGLDHAGIARTGLAAIAPLRERIRALASPSAVASVLAELHGIGVDALFALGPQPHPKESERHIAVVWQSGLGLPDREYYLKDGEPYASIRTAYATYISRLLVHTGTTAPEGADEAARRILAFETELARASLPLEVLRDPERTFHPHPPEELPALWAPWPWTRYLEARGLGSLPAPVNVAQPPYVASLARLLDAGEPEALRLYLEVRLLDATAPLLFEDLAQERFAFVRRLTGQPRLRRREERIASVIEETAGFALGRFYCARYVPPHEKTRVTKLFDALRRTLDERLERLGWLSPAARGEARRKLAGMRAKLAYPERWRDQSMLRFVEDDYLANILEGRAQDVIYETGKIGTTVDPEEWHMTPQTVNAYYSPPQNEIVFPAGILDRPFFDPEAPDAYNYGALGAVIGHEMLHGFDDQGRKYDARGNLRDWWTEDDHRRFGEHAARLREALAAVELEGGLKLKPDLVMGEVLADLGGLDLAYEAWRRYGSPEPGRGRFAGVDPEKLFFYAFAFLWAGEIRPDALRLQVDVDPHPPARVRVNFTTGRLRGFARAFGGEDPPEPFTLWSGA
jgi:putative endopeptidase